MKIETKNSLWECTIEYWCYSDYGCFTVVVSGNTYEEAKNTLKIYFQEDSLGDEDYCYGLMFYRNDKEDERWQYKIHRYRDVLRWNTNYWDAYRVTIDNLNVVYSGDEIAKPSL